ncbi:MAG: LPS export ABC transporter periplasmic protein LptC [Pseudohongiellaceae bacterium]
MNHDKVSLLVIEPQLVHMPKPLLLALLLIPAIALIAAFDQLPSNNPVESTLNKNELEFSAYSVGINTVIYDTDGAINYTLQANRQVQFKDDSTELDKPYVRLYQAGQPNWNLVADSGIISATEKAAPADQRTIEFRGNVEVYSLDGLGNRTVMKTQKLYLNPDTETLVTDLAVTVETSSINQTAIGMIAKLNTDEIVFQRDIRGIYEQPSPE